MCRPDEPACLVIDPGAEPSRILHVIEERKLEPIAVLVTHGHIDHVGALAAVARSTGAPVYSSRREPPWLRELSGDDYPGYQDTEPYEPDHLLEGGETLAVGPYEIGVRAVPGHSPGSVAFAVGRRALLAATCSFAARWAAPICGRGIGPRCRRASRRCSPSIPPETPVLSGHGEPTTLGDGARRPTRSSRSCAGERAACAPPSRRSTGCRRASRCASTSSTAAVRVFERAGFGQVVTPTFEDTALFSRTAGDASDVVSKEMYSFTDRGDRELTLRPEGTAPVVRAYLEHGLAREPQPVQALVLRADVPLRAAPSAGRYREHWQFGVEALGSDDPGRRRRGDRAAGAPGTRALGLLDGLELRAQLDRRPGLPAGLSRAARGLPRARSAASSRRTRGRALDINPLRIFDSKDERDRAIVAGAPRITDHLCEACAEHFAAVRALPRRARRRLPRRRRRWCAGSTTTSAPPGSGSSPAAARRPGRSPAAGATTAWPSRSAASACPASASAAASSASCSRSRRPGVEPPAPRRATGSAPATTPAARPRAARAARRARARGLACRGRPRRTQPQGPAAPRRAAAARASSRVCRAGDGERGIVRHGETEIAFGDVVDYVERSVRGAVSAYRDMLCGEPRAERRRPRADALGLGRRAGATTAGSSSSTCATARASCSS